MPGPNGPSRITVGGTTSQPAGRDLPAGQRAHREIPQRALPRDRLVDAGCVIRGDDPPQTPPAPGGTARPPRPPGAPLRGGRPVPGVLIVQYSVALDASTS